jgi:hypothetical protein
MCWENGEMKVAQEAMTERERFLRHMGFRSVDRNPLIETGFWTETLEHWHHEGVRKQVVHDRHVEVCLDLGLRFNRNWLPIDAPMCSPCEPKVREDHGDVQVIRDEDGVVYRQRTRHRTIPQHTCFPVESEAEDTPPLPRLISAKAERHVEDFDEDLQWRWERGEIVGVNSYGLFGFL